ncbi:hypothetical protein BSKO_13723 [Bryopsis sp. KO-2023]|nr:hypothetical protein BSKO_13723 [Bryopsis sp. KO-2023]
MDENQKALHEQRRKSLIDEARGLLCKLPHNVLNELPGRPQVVYELRNYSGGVSGEGSGAERARLDIPFLFKPFEVGQAPPPPPEADSVPRQSTIHEYLDWTVTAAPAGPGEELDFSGFRVVVLFARFRPTWPAPGAYESEGVKSHVRLGGPRKPLPVLLVDGKPVSAATVRCGQGFLEVPFFATREARRGKGYGRCLLEAIEDVARACGAVRLLLCSTDDPDTRATWKHLGFTESTEEDLEAWGVGQADLLHMTNTVQMYKDVGCARRWNSIKIKHGSFVQRSYYLDNRETSSKSCSKPNTNKTQTTSLSATASSFH